VVGPFPVAGLAWWGDDWHAPRCCPFAHLHQGLDIFAPFGTPLVAAADGYITQKVNSPAASGLGLEITDARGIQYFYAHLSAFEPGIELGTRVEIGQVIGYVGATGNARGTIPHLHFERQPDGIPAPPKPWVDRWLKIAERKAMRLVQKTLGEKPNVERLTFRLTRLFDLVDAERSDLDDAAAEAPRELLAASGLHPAATYDMVRDTAGTMAWEIDWGEEASDGITTGIQEYQQETTEQLLTGILQYPGPEATTVPTAGLPPGSPDVAVAEGIGDPTAPVATPGGGMATPLVAPEGEDAFAATWTEDRIAFYPHGTDVGSAGPFSGSGTDTSPPSLGESGSRSSGWRSAFVPGLAKALTLYGAFSTTLPNLMETAWHEMAAIQDGADP
jgi:hypothetical protein